MKYLFNKVLGLSLATLLKRDYNSYFTENLKTAAFEEENSYQVLLALFVNSSIKTSNVIPTL